MARIMVVDDDESVTRLVGRALHRRNHTVISARNGLEALQLLETTRPDLVILDLMMPKVDGLQVCRYMRDDSALASIPILFLTAKETIDDKIAGFEAGADDYLTKPFHLAELEMRLTVLLRQTGVPAPPCGPLTLGQLHIDPDERTVMVGGKAVELTPMEFEMFYYLAAREGEVISTQRLLRDVWGYPQGTGNHSLVRMHVLNVRRKIEKDPRHPTLICTVPRHGYVIHATAPD